MHKARALLFVCAGPFLLTAVIAVLSVGLASAQPGINLSWNDCDAGFSHAGLNMLSTCVNSGPGSTKRMYGSYRAPAGLAAVNAVEWLLVVQTLDDPLLCWWNMLPTNPLRDASWAMAANTPPASGYCYFYFGDAPSGVQFCVAAANYDPPGSNAENTNRIRWQGAAGISADEAPLIAQMAEDQEVYAFTFEIRPQNSANPSCPGCTGIACFVLIQMILSQTNAPTILLTMPADRHYVAWRGGAIGGAGCPMGERTPTANKTWGSIKTLYR